MRAIEIYQQNQNKDTKGKIVTNGSDYIPRPVRLESEVKRNVSVGFSVCENSPISLDYSSK